jgi:hypothetical protein
MKPLGFSAPATPIHHATGATPRRAPRRAPGGGRTKTIRPKVDAASSPHCSFVNLDSGAPEVPTLTLWHIGRGQAPSTSSTSGTEPVRRRRREPAAAPPAANHNPGADHATTRTAAGQKRPAATAPVQPPTSSRRRWRRRPRDAVEEEEQNPPTRSPPTPRRARPGTGLTDPSSAATKKANTDESEADLFAAATITAGAEMEDAGKPNRLATLD